jgi:hypothetical protein
MKALIALACLILLAGCNATDFPITGSDGHRYRVVSAGRDNGTGKVSDARVYERMGVTNRLYILALGSSEQNGTFISIAK